jgi:hypothetical protein
MNVSLTRHGNLLLGYLRPQWPRVALLAALLLGGIGLELLNPQILRAAEAAGQEVVWTGVDRAKSDQVVS